MRVTPPPSAVLSDGLATEPSSMFLSSTLSVVEFTVVVVPLTVRSPESGRAAALTVPVNVGEALGATSLNAISASDPLLSYTSASALIFPYAIIKIPPRLSLREL